MSSGQTIAAQSGASGELSDDEIPAALLTFLQRELRDPELAFQEAPVAASSGVESRVFFLRLKLEQGALAGPVVLKLFSPDDNPSRPRFEAIVQNALSEIGYPAPRAALFVTDTKVLGGPFVLMERLRGQPMIKTSVRIDEMLAFAGDSIFRMPRMLARTLAELHALDAAPVLRALTGAGFSQPPRIEDRLQILNKRINETPLPGLHDGMAWLFANRPPDPQRLVICHGDLWPGNIIGENGVPAGVIDWSMDFITLAAPELDLGVTAAGLLCGVIDLPPIIRQIARPAQRLVTRIFLNEYRRARPIDFGLLQYFQCYRALENCSWVALRRMGLPGPIRGHGRFVPWDLPGAIEGFARLFRKLTGVPVELPPALRQTVSGPARNLKQQ